MTYTGTAVSAGVVIGKVYLYKRFLPHLHDWPPVNPEADLAQYQTALDTARQELEALKNRFEKAGDQEKAGIFGAHLEILLDEVMDEEIRESIETKACNGPQRDRKSVV